MPYKRKYVRRRKNKKNAYSIATKALKKVNQIAQGIEVKHHDKAPAQIDLDNDPGFTILNDMESNITDDTRIGDRIKMLGLWLKMEINLNTVGQASFRFIVIYDKSNTINSISRLLSLSATENVVNSTFKVDTRDQYILLKDKRFSLSNGYNRERLISLSCKMNKIAQYESATTTVETGAVKLFAMSNLSTGLATKPYMLFYSRIWFQDS